MDTHKTLRLSTISLEDVEVEGMVATPTPTPMDKAQIVDSAAAEAPCKEPESMFFEERSSHASEFSRNRTPCEKTLEVTLKTASIREEKHNPEPSPEGKPKGRIGIALQKKTHYVIPLIGVEPVQERPRKNSRDHNPVQQRDKGKGKDDRRHPGRRDRKFDIGFELPSSTSHIPMAAHRNIPRNNATPRTGDHLVGQFNLGTIDSEFGRSIFAREVPEVGAGYVKTSLGERSFTKAIPHEDPSNYSSNGDTKGAGNHDTHSAARPWDNADEISGHHDDSSIVDVVEVDWAVEARDCIPEPRDFAKVLPSSLLTAFPPVHESRTVPPQAADFDARLNDNQRSQSHTPDPMFGLGRTFDQRPHLSGRQEASRRNGPSPAAVEFCTEEVGWSAPVQSNAGPGQRWGAASEEPALSRKSEIQIVLTESREEMSPVKQQSPQMSKPASGLATPFASVHTLGENGDRHNSYSGSIHVENPHGNPINLTSLSLNGKNLRSINQQTNCFTSLPKGLTNVGSSAYPVGCQPTGTLANNINAGAGFAMQQMWVTCPYCHCGFGYPSIPLSMMPPYASKQDFSSTPGSNGIRSQYRKV